MSIGQSLNFFSETKLTGNRGEVAEKIFKEVNARLQFLVNVGLEYLSLNRNAKKHLYPGGEAQRISVFTPWDRVQA